MSIVLVASVVFVCFVVFAAGAWLMLTSLTPQSRQYTHCAKCGTELESEDAAVCPKCRRVLTAEMRVTCSRSVIDRARLGRGAMIAGVALAVAIVVVKMN